MTSSFRLTLACAAAISSVSAWAVDPTLTQGGFTGMSITPNARLLDWGRVGISYDAQLPGGLPSDGSNYVLGIGLLPNIEVAGRVAANSNPDDCILNKCQGIRDLSASGKIGIGLDAGRRFYAALGATDLGGAATNFRSYYGVLTYDGGSHEASVGYARRGGARAGRPASPLDGPFVSAAWQPLPAVRGQVEYVDGNAWAGVRLFAPSHWLPEGWAAHVGVDARLTSGRVTERSWLSAGISIPLYKVPTLPAAGARAPVAALEGAQRPLPTYEARTLPAPGPAPQVLQPGVASPIAAPPTAASEDVLHALALALRGRGLEDISVGRMPDGTVAVRANNATYNWNTVDALGAALAAVAAELGGARTGYRLILTQRQLPLVAITGQADCLRDWLANRGAACTAGELSTPGSMPLELLHSGVAWVVRDLQPSYRTLRIAITPVLRTSVATEVGVLDYSAGVNVGFLQPLWSGASAELRFQQELARSNDYRTDGVYGTRRIRNGIERLVFTQTWRLPLDRWLGSSDEVAARRWGLGAVTTQTSLGRIGHHFDGLHAAVRWEPGDGRHRVTAQGGLFSNTAYGAIGGEARSPRPLLGTYRYVIAPTRTYVEATGGQFMNNDRGLQIGMRQWFSDVAIHAYLRRTRTEFATRNQAGLEISIPLGPRRDMNPAGVQFTGTPRFSHAIETVVGGGTNAVLVTRGVLPPAPSLESVHNSDRAGLVYFEDNIPRLRDAAH